jgi:hypothetical protein
MENNPRPWPLGCHDPSSCARHKDCMYIQCKRQGDEFVVFEIEQALRRIEEIRLEPELTREG